MDQDEIEKVETLPAELGAGNIDSSLAIGLARADVDSQIATAHRFPRKMHKVAQNILDLVTMDEETAEENMYALPRGGKPISGPSIRFAETVKSQFGNCRTAARVVHVDRVEKVVIAEGIFHDLETNTATRAEVRRRISGKGGRIYNDDMIIMTGNAACSIALRNAILGGVPKALWRKAYDAVQRTIAGDLSTLSSTREKAIKALANFGVTPEQVFVSLDVTGIEEVTLEHIPTLRGMFSALKNGEATVEEMFNLRAERVIDKNYNPLVSGSDAGETPKSAGGPEADDSVKESGGGAGLRTPSPLGDPPPSSTEQKPPPRSFAAEAANYHKALMRAMQKDSVPKIDVQFRAANAWTKEPGAAKVMADLVALHLKRVTNAVTAKEFTDEAKKLGVG